MSEPKNKYAKDSLTELLHALADREVAPEEAYERLKNLPYKNLEFARVDHHRVLRQGLPEVIYSPGKTPAQIVAIANELLRNNPVVVATKANEPTAREVKLESPQAQYFPVASMLIWGALPDPATSLRQVSVVTAGTADLPIAEEAGLYLTAAGVRALRLNDVGIAGVHRLLDALPQLESSAAHIVIAGMDGALPGLVAGLVAQPVIAVPTSAGYGASFGGVAALLTMLNSCAAGLTVVNIDNGFGGAAAALRVLSLLTGKTSD